MYRYYRPTSSVTSICKQHSICKHLRAAPKLSSMHYSAKIGIGTLVTVGAVAAYYHTSAHRRHLPTPVRDPQTKPVQIKPPVTSEISPPDPFPDPSNSQNEVDQDTQWKKFLDKLADANSSVLSTISIENVLPAWSIGLPDWMTRLQRELNMEPGSLADEIWTEAQDAQISPETILDARVRISADLCDDEKQFLRKRREFTRKALARYLDIPEEDVHEDDVPIIASTGSGGGLRAMVAGAGYYQALAEAGLFDCTTYSAGVSGSCWLQSMFLSSIGQQSFEKVIEHLKTRIGVHIAYPPEALELIDTPPTNKYLLRGVVEKLKVGQSSFGLVDLYGLLLAARLLVPGGDVVPDDEDLKLSSQKRFLEEGQYPLPIYTAVRHEIAEEVAKAGEQLEKEVEEQIKRPDWFQWFEVSPYEVYSEDMEGESE